MNPVRINIIVEGSTEETFVRDRVQSHLAPMAIYMAARSVETSRHPDRIHRGGLSDYAKPRGDIRRWLAQDRTAYVTTMFDLYQLPHDFPGWAAAAGQRNPYKKVEALEEALAADIDNPRFIPYIQLHEFEGLLFSDVDAIDHVLKILQGASRLPALRQIRASFDTPEHIDDGELTAPSKRLLSLYPSYDKVVFGSLISDRIGLQTMRRECGHFHGWLSRLEELELARHDR